MRSTRDPTRGKKAAIQRRKNVDQKVRLIVVLLSFLVPPMSMLRAQDRPLLGLLSSFCQTGEWGRLPGKRPPLPRKIGTTFAGPDPGRATSTSGDEET